MSAEDPRDAAATVPPSGSLGVATLWMLGALASFSLSAVSIRQLAQALSIFELLSLRSLFGAAVLLVVARFTRGGIHQLSLHRAGLQGLRHGVHWIGQAAWAYGITVLPLATVFAIEFTAPIWVTLLAVVFLGERITAPKIGAVVLGILGVLIILRPGYLPIGPASLAVLLAALSFAVTAVTTKMLTRTETTLAILFWMNLVQLPLNLVWCDPAFPLRIEAAQLPWIAGVCVTGLSSHYCLTQAFRHGDATVVVPMDFLRVPLIAVVGWWFYGERLDPIVFLGAASVVTGIIWNLLAAERQRNASHGPI